MKKQTKIAVFYGGKITQHLVQIREAAKKLSVKLDLISYNQVVMETEKDEIWIRIPRIEDTKKINIDEYGIVFFRTTGKHWEEVDLINEQLRITNYELNKKTIIVDPLVEKGKPSQACKAWQMKILHKEGIPVPKTIYGSLWFLYETMRTSNDCFPSFPIILKGSGGDRGTSVYIAKNLEEMEKLVTDLRKSETESGKRYMIQEFIENDGDFRVLVLGEKVLGVMRRYRTRKDEFRNNFSAGGEVEVADLPESVKKMALKAAKICGLAVAGVDVMPKGNDYVILEVNKGPQFKGFMRATGIDVPAEIVKYLISLDKTS